MVRDGHTVKAVLDGELCILNGVKFLIESAPDLHVSVFARERCLLPLPQICILVCPWKKGKSSDHSIDESTIAMNRVGVHVQCRRGSTVSHGLVSIFKISNVYVRDEVRVFYAFGHTETVSEFVQSSTLVGSIKS